MTELSQDQVDEIVARVTDTVRAEVLEHLSTSAVQGDLRISLRNANDLPDAALWAPWTVAMPADLTAQEVHDGPGAAG